MFRRTFTLIASISCLLAAAAPPPIAPLPASVKSVLDTISAAQLRGDLSFLASDALQGRFTPSPGLEVAAEFIASKFRAAGLEPGGTEDYFQIAHMVERRMPKPNGALTITLQTNDKPSAVVAGTMAGVQIPASSYVISQSAKGADVSGAFVVLFSSPDLDALKKMELTGKAILIEEPDFHALPQDKAIAAYGQMRAFNQAAAASKAALEIVVRRSKSRPSPPSRLISAEEAERASVPMVIVTGSEILPILKEPKPAFASINIPAPEDQKVTVKNVTGILRGSDPQLKSTCVLLTAHYDHIGTLDTAKGLSSPSTKATDDHIYNGANDDGSGTVSVLEIAQALARLKVHPKRSLVFMTFFGEERGELGSKFYGEHPVFPIDKTVADINLEQVGRTDSTTGKQINTASLTGYDYSSVTKFLEEAGRETGIKVYKDPEASDAYFTRSDNDALAEQGVPAHSLTVAFDYPDYHGLGDEWNKVDYDNMARVDRMIGLGLLHIANSARAPEWNAANPKTQPFRDAQKRSFQSHSTP